MNFCLCSADALRNWHAKNWLYKIWLWSWCRERDRRLSRRSISALVRSDSNSKFEQDLELRHGIGRWCRRHRPRQPPDIVHQSLLNRVLARRCSSYLWDNDMCRFRHWTRKNDRINDDRRERSEFVTWRFLHLPRGVSDFDASNDNSLD